MKFKKPKVNLPKVNVPKPPVAKVNLPKVNLPKINVPKVNVPKVNVPKSSIPKISANGLRVPKTSMPKFVAGKATTPKVSGMKPGVAKIGSSFKPGVAKLTPKVKSGLKSASDPLKNLNPFASPKHRVINKRTPQPTPVEPVEIMVFVYKIFNIGGNRPPIWHTGTAIGANEYYFQTTNKVETCPPGEMPGMKVHRKIVRKVRGDLARVNRVLEQVKRRWNGTRYDVLKRNCNFFTDELLRALGSKGLDKEYLHNGGMRDFLSRIPGTSTLQEILLKNSMFGNGTTKLDQSLKEDILRYFRVMCPGLPVDAAASSLEKIGFKARNAVTSTGIGGAIADGIKRGHNSVRVEAGRAGGTISKGAKSAGGTVAKKGKKILFGK
jgi:hypothetical protein